MEVRARYVQMGLFTLAVLALGFGFVYWINNAGGLSDRAAYRIQFEGPVSGLLRGSAVLFNGIRVGEVTALKLDPAQPRQVDAIISVDRGAPVRKDTEVSVDFQGLTGSPVVALSGGSSAEPIAAAKGELPLLKARSDAGETMSQSARDVLRRLDAILAENAKPLREMIANIDTFAGALARNADKIDGIAAGLERMTGGAAARARALTFNLHPLRVAEAKERTPAAQIVVPESSALSSLDSEKIATVSASGELSAVPDGQWSDAVTRIVQAAVIRGLEDSHAFAGVSRPLDDLIADFRLVVDVRKFQIGAAQAAEVEIGSKIIDSKGSIIAAQVFRGSAPLTGTDAASAAAAIDRAFGKAGPDLVTWAARAIAEHSAQKRPEPKKAAGE
jgi:phospholipid/cholesterol/gamma-HCH transport system substrate-binding protein